jgi:6-pyruvoyltetrahydropterin/6-carboxytetrahydropterin synthase
MFTISKKFEFSASHVLEGLPEGHQCGRLHGHNYIVEVELQAERLNEPGFVHDYGELAPLKVWLDETFDHQHINERMEATPTAEHMALLIHTKAVELFGEAGRQTATHNGFMVSAVRVYETPKTCAEYRQ